jgi:hypothetical protein
MAAIMPIRVRTEIRELSRPSERTGDVQSGMAVAGDPWNGVRPWAAQWNRLNQATVKKQQNG